MQFLSGQPTFIIAEIGANHNGDMALAKKMIDVAKQIGCDAVKFQSWDTSLFSQEVYDKNYFLGDDYRNRSDYTLKQIVDEFALDDGQLRELNAYCREKDIVYSTTPFSVPQLEQLLAVDPPYVKIASMDVNNPRLLKAAGESGRTILLSTGFATLAEIDRAIGWIEATGNRNIVVLHCVALYPPDDREVNLNNMDMLRRTFGYPVGFSDHTLGSEIALAAIAKGAVVLEKHFTLDKSMFGWDHHMSADPAEMTAIARGRDRIAAALGSERRMPGRRELERRAEYRRSIVSARAIAAGKVIGEDDVDLRRPGTGIEPPLLPLVVGRRAARDIPADTVLKLSDLES
jgi:N-acetylneuraminate synthase